MTLKRTINILYVIQMVRCQTINTRIAFSTIINIITMQIPRSIYHSNIILPISIYKYENMYIYYELLCIYDMKNQY